MGESENTKIFRSAKVNKKSHSIVVPSEIYHALGKPQYLLWVFDPITKKVTLKDPSKDL